MGGRHSRASHDRRADTPGSDHLRKVNEEGSGEGHVARNSPTMRGAVHPAGKVTRRFTSRRHRRDDPWSREVTTQAARMTPRRAVKGAGARVPAHTAEPDDHSRAAAGWPSALADEAVDYAAWPRHRNRLMVTNTGTLARTAQALQGLPATAPHLPPTRP